MFPVDPEALDGRRVLLIVVAEESPWAASFVNGIAHWREGRFSLTCGQPPAAFQVPGTREALLGWDPALLPRIIVAKHAPTVLAVAQGVDACVSVFATCLPPGAVTLPLPFYGLGKNTVTGACLLFQGEPELVSPDQEVSAEPWASDPWTPDAETWNSDEEAT